MRQTGQTERVVAVLLTLLSVHSCDSRESSPPPPPVATEQTRPGDLPTREPSSWNPPSDPARVPPAALPRVGLLTAPWCQWCMVLHETVIPTDDVKRAMAGFEFSEINVDDHPSWMSLRGVAGLPTFVFFDANGDHVLSKSGFTDVAELVDLLTAVRLGIAEGKIQKYDRRPISRLLPEPMSPESAHSAILAFERALFFKVNSNEGGFGSPSRQPRPKLLWSLQQWVDGGSAPARVNRWIELTVAGATRGSSPTLSGVPLPDMRFSPGELARLSADGAGAGARWRSGIEALPTMDPYLGLRDVDGGYFRYAAGPGWYHPHFERLADENLAWVLLLDARGMPNATTREWTMRTFARDDGWLNLAQHSDPFYFRLRPEQRRGVAQPPVSACAALAVQAWAAMVDSTRCDPLFDAMTSAWPPSRLADPDAPPATVDAVGELLVAAGRCDAGPRVAGLASTVVADWKSGLPADAALHRLAAGLCAIEHPSCRAALNTVRGIPVDTRYAPPFVALARLEGRRGVEAELDVPPATDP